MVYCVVVMFREDISQEWLVLLKYRKQHKYRKQYKKIIWFGREAGIVYANWKYALNCGRIRYSEKTGMRGEPHGF